MSEIEYGPFFEKYEKLAEKVNEAFNRISDAHPELVMCKSGCTDCCYALFDLTLIEAMYLKHHFDLTFPVGEGGREEMLEKANRADRKIYKLKKAAFKKVQEGEDEAAVVEEMARERIRCPLLNAEDQCDLYPHRPLACRIYGVPLAIGGEGRTCGKSGFSEGESYPTVNMDALHDQLMVLSSEFVRKIDSKFTNLAEVLVPVSMALLTDYSEEYLGLQGDDAPEAKAEGKSNE